MTSSMVVEVNRAVAIAMASGPSAGLEILEPLAAEADAYYPYHAARADLLRRMDRRREAAQAYARALALCPNTAERSYLERRRSEMLAPAG